MRETIERFLNQRGIVLVRFEFPRYWEEIVEPVASGNHAVARIRRLFAQYPLGQADGVAFYLKDTDGNMLEVLITHNEWAVAYLPNQGTALITLGDAARNGMKNFLIPEWTPMQEKYLVPKEVASRIVEQWVDRGTLDDVAQWSR